MSKAAYAALWASPLLVLASALVAPYLWRRKPRIRNDDKAIREARKLRLVRITIHPPEES